MTLSEKLRARAAELMHESHVAGEWTATLLEQAADALDHERICGMCGDHGCAVQLPHFSAEQIVREYLAASATLPLSLRVRKILKGIIEEDEK